MDRSTYEGMEAAHGPASRVVCLCGMLDMVCIDAHMHACVHLHISVRMCMQRSNNMAEVFFCAARLCTLTFAAYGF